MSEESTRLLQSLHTCARVIHMRGLSVAQDSSVLMRKISNKTSSGRISMVVGVMRQNALVGNVFSSSERH